MGNIKRLKFAANYNNKLNTEYFTTIRLGKSKCIGQNFLIECPNIEPFIATVIDMKTGRLGDLNEFACYQDAGMNRTELMCLLKEFYPKYVVNENTIIFFHLLKRIHK
jgi:hypothetical protein